MIRHADDAPDDDGAQPGPDLDGSTMPPDDAGGAVDRDERLGEAIEAYLELAEGGTPPPPEDFARGYPDLGDDLLAALEGLALVEGLVGSPAGPGHRLEEGRRVAGYRIVRELGRGGMGVVYEAVHVGLDRPVALKVLGSQAAPDSSGRRRFLNEARTAAGLHHTHIVPVFDVGQVGGLCYYAMQRIEGSGLDRVLRVLRRDRTVASGSTHGSALRPGKAGAKPLAGPHPPADGHAPGPGPSLLGDETLSWGGERPGAGARWRLDPDADADAEPVFLPPRGSGYYRWVADVGRQAAEALAHAHQRGIIHRDIKPSNLLVDARGMVWVADFGLARRLADPSQTQVDSLLGTPRYMSPEQARTGAIDGRADVYSLGATLYELITLRPPFDGQTAAELIDQIATREPGRPRKFDPRVPLDLETILLKALAKRAADRYAGAAELAEDLGRFLAHEPVRARRIGPVGRAWRFARRHPGASTVSVLAASLVLTTATVAYVRIDHERDRANIAAAEASRSRDAEKAKNSELRAEVVQRTEEQATNTLHSAEPKRRAKGLDLVRQAANLGRQMPPDPDRRVRLRDLAMAFLTLPDVEELPSIPSPDGPRRSLAFGPNGQRIAALTDDGELGVWNVATREPVGASIRPIAPARRSRGGRGGMGRLPMPGERAAMAGDQLLVVKSNEGGVSWYDLGSPQVGGDDLPIRGQTVATVLAAADGRHFLTVGQPESLTVGRGAGPEPGDARPKPEEPRICLWDRDHPETPKATLALPAARTENAGTRFLLAMAPDGSRIAAARFYDSEVAIWDGNGDPLKDGDGRPLNPISIQGNATALALGPAGQLAVAGGGGEVALWDLSRTLPKPMPSLNFHQSFIGILRFGPDDGLMLAAASQIGTGVELWDLATHTPIAALKTAEGVTDLAFAPDGRTLAAGQSTSVALWSLVEPTGQSMLPESGDFPLALAFGPDDLLAIASADASNPALAAPLRLWGGPGQCPVSLASWPKCRPSSVGFDGDGRMFAAEGDALRWFDPPSAEPTREVPLPADPHADARPNGRPGGRPGDGALRILARTASGGALLLARREGLFLWRAADPAAPTRLKFREAGPGPGQVWGAHLALAPDGARLYHLAQQGRSQVLMARDLDAHEVHPPSWAVTTTQANMVVLSPDGRTIAVGTYPGRVELRSAADGSLAGELVPPGDDNAGPVESLAFSPDGRTVAVGGREQVRLWAVAGPPRSLVRLPGHRGSVRTLAFDPAGTRLAGADEKAVKVWDLGRLRDELGRLGLGW